MAMDSGAGTVVRPGERTSRSLDRLFDLLSDQRRRYVLSCLADHGRSVGLVDLAREVAGRENEASATEVPHEAVQEVYASLHHVHLPKLVDAGVLEYDPDRNVVRASETTDAVERVRSLAVDCSTER